jgi:sec-independent protein translocase protein TatC
MSDESDERDTDAGADGSPGADRGSPDPADDADAGPSERPQSAPDGGVDRSDSDPTDATDADPGSAPRSDPDADDAADPGDATAAPDPDPDPDPDAGVDGLDPAPAPSEDATADPPPDREPDGSTVDRDASGDDGGAPPTDDGSDGVPDARDADPTPEDSTVEFTEQGPDEVPETVRDAPSPGDLVDDGGGGGAPDPMSAAADPAGAGAGGGGATPPAPPVEGDEEIGGILGGHEEQPPDDEEMPLADHIEEMVRRLAVVVIAVALATAIGFPFATEVLNAMWYGLLPPDTPAPHLYGPLEKILSEVKVASLAGVLVALPVLVYEAYLFMRPGLYPKERRYFLSAVPTSLVLGAIGMAFAYFLVLPVLFDYFVLYSESGVDKLAFSLRVTFDLIVALLGAFALVFQVPLLMMLAILMGVTTRQWLEARRLYFWAGFLGVGFLMGGADLTGMAPIIIAATMIGLFEGTLALLRWTQRG